MEREEKEARDTETLRKIVQSDCYDLGQRLVFVTDWLKEAGLSQEAIMLGYFNECMSVATENGSIMGSYIMATKLHSHVARLIEKLYAASHAVYLAESPAGPTVKKSDPE